MLAALELRNESAAKCERVTPTAADHAANRHDSSPAMRVCFHNVGNVVGARTVVYLSLCCPSVKTEKPARFACRVYGFRCGMPCIRHNRAAVKPLTMSAVTIDPSASLIVTLFYRKDLSWKNLKKADFNYSFALNLDQIRHII